MVIDDVLHPILEHPTDYATQSKAIIPDLTHVLAPLHNRLFLRISVECSAGFTSLTFVCDTGAPGYLYLSDRALGTEVMQSRFLEEEDTGIKYVVCKGRKIPYRRTPDSRQPANMMGLKLMYRFGLKLSEPPGLPPEFKLEDLPEFL